MHPSCIDAAGVQPSEPVQPCARDTRAPGLRDTEHQALGLFCPREDLSHLRSRAALDIDFEGAVVAW